ncbi:LCP family protein [Neobacillus sp. D3-1R]|uniref:LCP family protein n=1 Tax=Neobacillus sp. D3-1R TaxID=3445778 RepID=UPI003FA13AB6
MTRTIEGKRQRQKKTILLILGVLILSVVGYGAMLIYKANETINNTYVDLKRDGNKSELREEEVIFGKEPISILLLGVEKYSTDGKDGRADTQMVVTLNPDTNEMKMVTIPRDTRVMIDNAGEYTGIHKINSAYTYGSITGYGAAKLQIETIEKLLDVPIDRFIAIDFDGFREIVDAVGGVDIDIKKGFWEKNIFDDNKKIHFEQGMTHLNGEEALAFVRMRKRAVNATYTRDERQEQFLHALVDQAVSTKTILKVGKISEILGKHVESDLTAEEIYDLQRRYSKINRSSIQSLAIAGQDQRVNGGSYFIPTREGLEEVHEKLLESLGLDQDHDFETNADVR